MLAGLRAGNVKEPPLGLKNIVELRFIRRIRDPFIKRQNALVACHHNHSAEYNTARIVSR